MKKTYLRIVITYRRHSKPSTGRRTAGGYEPNCPSLSIPAACKWVGHLNTSTTMLESIETPKVQGDAIVDQALAAPSDEERMRQERLELLESLRIKTDTQVEPEAYSLTVDGVGIFALSDIHGLKGKQKSGKSAVLKVCTAALLGGQQFRVKSELEEPRVLLIDTEQQAADVRLVIDEVRQMSGVDADYIDTHLWVYTLRRMSYDTLLNDTRLLIETHQPQVVLVDGVVDYVASFNDEVMSRQLIHDLLVLCEEHKCAIVNVLHENKAAEDENMRGHLGTVLAQKAGTVLQCHKSRQGVITVTCPDSRHGAMPEWSIRFDHEGHLEDADLLHQQEQQANKDRRAAERQAEHEQLQQQRLDAALVIIRDNGCSISRSELTKKLEEQMKLSRPTVSKFITQMVKDGKLYEADKVITATTETALAF